MVTGGRTAWGISRKMGKSGRRWGTSGYFKKLTQFSILRCFKFPRLEIDLMMFKRKTSSKRKRFKKKKRKTLQERCRETDETKGKERRDMAGTLREITGTVIRERQTHDQISFLFISSCLFSF